MGPGQGYYSRPMDLQSDCHMLRGCEFDPSHVPYLRGDYVVRVVNIGLT